MDPISLVGRHDDQEVAQALMARSVRLLTLWGPPGIGKTSLAHALVADASPSAFVSLASVQGLEEFEAAVVPTLSRLSRGWVVLDNIEHLLHDEADGPAVLGCIRRWLDDTPPTVSFLVTSRRRLRMAEEHPVELKPLDAEHSLELFIQLLQRHRPGFTPQQENRGVLLDLVRALDGLPLAMELAAPRWELLGTAELLRRLSAPLAVLAGPSHTDPRHATLRRAIAWSWDLLEARDQRALESLAVFAGPFALSDAEALLGPGALDRVESLRNNGLVQVPSPGHLEMLATIKAFAREQTTPERALELANAHATWLIDRCGDLNSRQSVAGVRGEVWPAARFLVERRDPRVPDVLGLLQLAAPGQNLGLFDDAIARMDSARTRLMRSHALRRARRPQQALEDVEAGLAMDPDPKVRAHLQVMVGILACDRLEFQAAEGSFERALVLARASGNRRAEAMAVGNLAVIDSNLGRFESSERRYEAALRSCRAVGLPRQEAHLLVNLGLLRQEQGLFESAEVAYRKAIAVLETEESWILSHAEGALGVLYHEMGRLEEAYTLHEQAHEHLADVGTDQPRSLALARLAATEAALGDVSSARAHLREAMLPWADQPEKAPGMVPLFEALVAQVEGRDDEVARLVKRTAATHSRTTARIVLRILRRKMTSGVPALEVGEDWFEPPDGERADLGRHASLRRMFHALVDAREANASLEVFELFEAGWPGEQITVDSSRNRVHVNLAKLRALGLRGLLLRSNTGYLLDPSVPIERSDRV